MATFFHAAVFYNAVKSAIPELMGDACSVHDGLSMNFFDVSEYEVARPAWFFSIIQTVDFRYHAMV